MYTIVAHDNINIISMKYYQQVLSSLNENGNIPSLNSLQSSFPSPEIYFNEY